MQDPPREATTPRAHPLRELPFVLGLALALLFLFHPGFHRFGYPQGADWDTYLASAGHLWLDPVAYRYNEWRQPLYPLLIGLLGSRLGYVLAGQVLALVGSAASAVGAGLLARALAGPWAGGLAALTAAFVPLLVEGSWWVNPYPLVAGTGALALAAGVGCCRRPGPWLAGLAGLFGGVALALDLRSLAVAGALPLLAVLGPGSARRRMCLGALCLGCVAGGAALDQGLRAGWDLRIRSFGSQLAIQHEDMPGPGAPPAPEGVARAAQCERAAGATEGAMDLLGPCAAERRAGNWAALRGQGFLPPGPLLVAALLACLLPAAWGRRAVLASALVFLPTALSVAMGSSLVLYPSRYLLPVVPLLCALVPVALARACAAPGLRWAPVRPAARAAPLLAVLVLVLAWPGFDPSVLLRPMGLLERRKGGAHPPLDAREELLAWVPAELGAEDRLYDCAELRLSMALLPERYEIVDFPPHDPACQRLILHPRPAGGRTWLFTLHDRSGRLDPRLLGPEQVARAGWIETPLPGWPDDGGLERFGIKRWRLPDAPGSAAGAVGRGPPKD